MKKQLSYIQNLRSDILNSKEEAINKFDEIINNLEPTQKLDSVELITRYKDNETNQIKSLLAILAYNEETNKIDKTIINQIQNNNSNEILINEINQLKEEVNNLKELVNNNNNTEEEKDEFGSGYDIDNDYWIHCEYNITNIGEETQLFSIEEGNVKTCDRCSTEKVSGITINHLSKIFSMKIDGIIVENKCKKYKFNTLGKHTVDILLNETTETLPCMFYNIKNIVKIILPFSIKIINNNTFNGCENLKYIQFNMFELPQIKSQTFAYLENTIGIIGIRNNIEVSKLINDYGYYMDDGYKVTTYYVLPKTWSYSYIDNE